MEAMSQQHTPTPWKARLESDGDWAIEPMNGQIEIAQVYLDAADKKVSDADAAFIVQACNSHAALVDALKRTKVLLEALNGSPGFAHLEHEIPAIRAALKLAQEAK